MTITQQTTEKVIDPETFFVLRPHLLIVSADLDGIWDELGGLLLSHRGHIFQQDSDL